MVEIPITETASRAQKSLLSKQKGSRGARLIDKGTLGLEASVSGQAERYGRGKTSHTIHVWWARRPHGAMRALTFASLMPAGNGETQAVMRELAFAASPDAPVVKEAQRLLKSQYPVAPKVLDVFGGGGTIPYEAALLGAEVSSLDYNPLSVFIQKANLEFAQEALAQLEPSQLVRVIQDAGTRVLTTLRERTADLFPLRSRDAREGIFAYFWSYRFPCAGCGRDFLLMKRPWLSRKAGRHTALSMSHAGGRASVTIDRHAGREVLRDSVWPGRNGTVRCPHCGKEHRSPSIQDCSDALLATGELLKRGKAFRSPPKGAVPTDEHLANRERRLLQDGGLRLPESRLPKWSGIVNAALYGIETHGEFLNKRQRLVLLELVNALREESAVLKQTQSAEVARYAIATLSSLIDQLVDWNCRLSMWISQNEQVGRAFCGPGVPMLWDYVETDPVLGGPANLWDKLDRILAAVAATPRFAVRPTVYEGRAQNLPFESNFFDAVITDPPYYDNLYYNVLADFLYTWKRPLLEPLAPELFRAAQCEESAELVSSHFRQGANAHEWYCSQLTQCLAEVKRVLKRDGILSFVFSHSSLAGWEAVVQSFRRAGLHLTSAEPLSIERRQRPRAVKSEAVNTCIVLVGQEPHIRATSIDIADVEETVRSRKFALTRPLKASGWRAEDIGMALFAQGVVAIANASRVTGVDSDADALRRIGHLVGVLVPGFTLQVRQSL